MLKRWLESHYWDKKRFVRRMKVRQGFSDFGCFGLHVYTVLTFIIGIVCTWTNLFRHIRSKNISQPKKTKLGILYIKQYEIKNKNTQIVQSLTRADLWHAYFPGFFDYHHRWIFTCAGEFSPVQVKIHLCWWKFIGRFLVWQKESFLIILLYFFLRIKN